ncbi:a-kinase anchor protein 7 isoform gamma [Nephila pilipes]|uniref:A-kinase anchor protein 7 isoform gamma n=1 Tax=Nephila pilipes TaxID=299642 RepID=A0A8X6NPV6_NEPPI|nr:a-kinase anchor protein 7 isoform gamma [Nephila pilipes]
MDYLSRTVGICFLVIESLKVVRKRIPILSHRGFHPPSWSKPVCPRIVVIDSKDGENTSELSTASRNVEKSDRNFSKMFYSSSVYSKSFHGGETSISNASPKKLKIEPSLKSSNFVNRYKGEAPPENKRNMRPNYFVAVQISSPIIHQAVQNIQNHIVNQNMQFNDCMISVLTLHITLMVMSIDNKETYDRAIKALQNVYMEHNDVMCKKPLQLEFCGLGHFHNRVLYAKLRENESFKRFCDLAECVRKHFADVEIFSTDERKFNPHLTIAKLNFSKKTQRALKKIAPALYEIFIDEYIGIETIRGIQLLSMTSPKDSVGYYKGDNLIFESSSSTPPEISATSSYDSKLGLLKWLF